MAITNGYTDLETFKANFMEGQGYTADPSNDGRIESVITAVSRVIDNYTDRRFYVTSETRYYTARYYDLLYVDDYTGITTLSTDDDDDAVFENTWATTDYHNMPLNASVDSEPFTRIQITSNGNYSFPLNVRGVELTATFGYGATAPAEIVEATLIGAGRIWKRKDAIFGVAGTNALGLLQTIQSELRSDPDFIVLLDPFVRLVGN